MNWFEDGDQIVVTRDDFVDLQESPAVFIDKDSEAGQMILKDWRVTAMPLGDLLEVRRLLDNGGGALGG